jgi:hypothetical protein
MNNVVPIRALDDRDLYLIEIALREDIGRTHKSLGDPDCPAWQEQWDRLEELRALLRKVESIRQCFTGGEILPPDHQPPPSPIPPTAA